ncbi:hypothetical protein RFI_34417 [Reticulomyxa filosa]|uniref:Uncharacterized protein n=1 Tax=Reticulomyxa filosa TaxID=46433 RepID=X6LM38_RETFI|nr:hypothetical protein RFI_34417 [Reticulomyxa filosa]|eukprot:ETO02993.1 hypothetical protein RFI_34417 [Reticulomyxa filosa]
MTSNQFIWICSRTRIKIKTFITTISSQLGGKQSDNAFQFLIHGSPSYFCHYYTQFIMKLKEEQLGDENEYNRKNCAELLGELSMKWNEKQLNDAFNSLKDMFNKDYHWRYIALETIEVKLSGEQFDNAFNYFINRLNCEGG